MKLSWRTAIIGPSVAMLLLASLAQAQDRGVGQVGPGAAGAGAGQQRRIGMDPVDDRVQLRDYLFKDTDEILPYALLLHHSFNPRRILYFSYTQSYDD